MADIPILNTFPHWSHGGIPFPVAQWRHRGGQRFATHERPKVPGARLEKMGRRAHVFSATILFDETFNAGGDVVFPDLYPTNAKALLDLWDRGVTTKLLVPGRGEYQAFCANYDASFDAKLLSGERVEAEFHEDVLDVDFGIAVARSTIVSLGTRLATLLAAIREDKVAFDLDAAGEQLAQRLSNGENILGQSVVDAIAGTINSILAVQDQIELYDQLVAGRIEMLLGLCQKLERSSTLLDCRSSATFQALMDVWSTAQAMAGDLFAKKSPLRRYPVPRLMTIDEASVAIYGDATHTTDLLTLNAIDDPFALPAGSFLTFYEVG